MHSPIESPAGLPARTSGTLRVRRAVAVAAVAAAVTGGPATPAFAQTGARPAPAGVSIQWPGGTSRPASSRIAAYWTRGRMLSAQNADLVIARPRTVASGTPQAASGPARRVIGAIPVGGVQGAAPALAHAGLVPMDLGNATPWTGDPSLPPATTSGKVFFTTTANGGTQDWTCSGSTVNSSGKDVVITAGQCLYGSLSGVVPGETWHSNWVFVPGYDDGLAPFGVWTAKELATLTSYVSNQDEGDDIGAAVMNADESGQHIVDVVGGEGIEWNGPSGLGDVFAFGYPAESPFDGTVLDECDSSVFNNLDVPNTEALGCSFGQETAGGFTAGSEGGPWMVSFGGEFGYVNGVNGFAVEGTPTSIFSPYFGNNAGSLYNAVAGL